MTVGTKRANTLHAMQRSATTTTTTATRRKKATTRKRQPSLAQQTYWQFLISFCFSMGTFTIKVRVKYCTEKNTQIDIICLALSLSHCTSTNLYENSSARILSVLLCTNFYICLVTKYLFPYPCRTLGIIRSCLRQKDISPRPQENSLGQKQSRHLHHGLT